MSDRAIAAPFRNALLAPRYWPTWIGLGLLWLAARLPYRLLFALGRRLGAILRQLVVKRSAVARRNLELCFPELDAAARERLLDANLRNLGTLVAELALASLGSPRALRRIPLQLDGLEHLVAAQAQGRGVLLISAHFSHMELAVRLLSLHQRFGGMSRAQGDAAFEWLLARRRARYVDAVFRREDLRAMVKYLRRGGIVWYSPDHGVRGKDSVFVPFFGIAAATLTATHHLARMSGAVVIPFFHKRLADGQGYALRLEAPLADFPSDDVGADSARINATVERMIREAPEQYLWLYKRFKVRPEGEPDLYQAP